MKKLSLIILTGILVLGFVVRLYRLNNPIADWHEWRQADTSAVSRNFVDQGFDILHPKFDDLSNVASGLDNPMGYRFVEFPLYNIAQAGLFEVFHTLTLEEWGRIVSIIASTFSSLFIFLIVKRKANTQAALISSFFFSLLPFSIYYGRVILPDPSMVATILGGIYFLDLFLESENKKKWIYFTVSLVLTSASLLLKPYALFFALPMACLVFDKYGIGLLKKWYLWIFLIISILPLALWREWMTKYPEGIPVSDWLFNQGNIRFKGAFFYWIFGDRLSRLILGYFGIFPFLLGFLAKLKKQNLFFFLSFAVASLAYVTILAAGNVQHDYYQILIIPTIAIFAGLGGDLLLKYETFKYIKYPMFLAVISLSLFLGWYFVRDYFDIDNPSIVIAGQIIDQITPKDSKVIADYGGDTAFLYQTDRKGWASQEKPIPDMVNLGADYLAEVNPTQKDFFLKDDYKIVYSSDKLLLYDLHQKP